MTPPRTAEGRSPVRRRRQGRVGWILAAVHLLALGVPSGAGAQDGPVRPAVGGSAEHHIHLRTAEVPYGLPIPGTYVWGSPLLPPTTDGPRDQRRAWPVRAANDTAHVARLRAFFIALQEAQLAAVVHLRNRGDVHAKEDRPVESTATDTVRVATPTGERVTDRENVQAAFDAVQPGGTVVFAAGSYVVGGEGLVLRTPGVALRGDPDGTTLLGCTRTQRMDLSAREFSEVCGDGLVLAAEAQRVSGLRFESFYLALSIREATEVEEQGRSSSFTGGHVVEDNSFHDGFSFQIDLDADSTVRIRRNVFRNVWHAVAIGGRNIHVTENDIAVPEPERVPFGFPGVAIGIRPLGEDGACSSMIVEDNRIDGHTEAVAIAVFPQDLPGCVCSDIMVRDNEIVMRPVRIPDGMLVEIGRSDLVERSDQAGALAIAPAIRLFNAQRLVSEGLIAWEERMPDGRADALSEGRISNVRVENNRITGAVGVAIEAAHVTDSRIVDNEIEVRPATTPGERDGLTVGGNGGPGVWVLLGFVDEVNGTPVWVSAGSEGTIVRPPPRRRSESDGGGD